MNRIRRAVVPILVAVACGGPDAITAPDDDSDHHREMVIESIPYEAIGQARIAFRRTSATGAGIVILDGIKRAATTHLDRNAYYMEVSPAGTRVAYVKETASDNPQRSEDVNISDIDSPVGVELGGVGGTRSFASWTPDGSRVIYRETDLQFSTAGVARLVSQLPSPGAIREILWQASGGCESAIDPHANAAGDIVFVYYPASSDCLGSGSRIARKKAGQPLEILYVPAGLNVNSPAWSPNGSEIAFVESLGMAPAVYTYLWEVQVMAADGSNLRTLATFTAGQGVGSLCWGADGSTLFFVEGGYHFAKIYALRAMGGTPVPITTEPTAIDFPLTCLR